MQSRQDSLLEVRAHILFLLAFATDQSGQKCGLDNIRCGKIADFSETHFIVSTCNSID
jgi:hypothetical protein